MEKLKSKSLEFYFDGRIFVFVDATYLSNANHYMVYGNNDNKNILGIFPKDKTTIMLRYTEVNYGSNTKS